MEVAKKSIRGSVLLFMGNVGSTAIAAAASITIARLLTPGTYGVYVLALVTPSILQLFLGLGITSAITRFVALHVSRGELEAARSVTRTGVLFIFTIGVALTLTNFVSADYLSEFILRRPELSPYVREASLLLLGQALFQSTFSSFIGWSMIGKASLSTVLQATLKLAIAPTLVLGGLGVYGAILGHVASYTMAGVTSAVFLYFYSFRLKTTGWSTGFSNDLSAMLRYSFPLYAGEIVSGLTSQSITLLLAAISSNAVVGEYQAALNITVAVGLLSSAVASVLLPAFASLQGSGASIGEAFGFALKYVAFSITPVVVFLVSASAPLVSFVYGPYFLPSTPLLELLALSYLPISIGLTVYPSFFNGVGKTRFTMFATIPGSLLLLALAPVFSIGLHYGVNGILYSIMLSNGVTSVIALSLAHRFLGVRLDPRSLAGVLSACLLSALAVYYIGPKSGNLLYLAIDALLFAGVYLTSAPLLGALDLDDIRRLTIAFTGMSLIGQLPTLLLRYEEALLRIARGGLPRNGE